MRGPQVNPPSVDFWSQKFRPKLSSRRKYTAPARSTNAVAVPSAPELMPPAPPWSTCGLQLPPSVPTWVPRLPLVQAQSSIAMYSHCPEESSVKKKLRERWHSLGARTPGTLQSLDLTTCIVVSPASAAAVHVARVGSVVERYWGRAPLEGAVNR